MLFLREALGDIVEQCLGRAGIDRPPVNPERIRRALGYKLFPHEDDHARGTSFRRNGVAFVSIRPDDRAERRHFSLAHEIAELQMRELSERVGEPLHRPFREEVCDQLAGMLLCPPAWFRADCRETGFDLFELKRLYETASYEVIAWRMLEADESAFITIFDTGMRPRRRPNPTAPFHPLERLAQREANETSQPIEHADEGVRVKAWPVHEVGNPVKREIVRASFDDWGPA